MMEGSMDVLYPCCAGLDVHKDSVVAAVRLADDGLGQDRSAHIRYHNAGAAGAVRLVDRVRLHPRRMASLR
jgi:hypothetical protein